MTETPSAATERSEYIVGLRELALLLETNPTLPLPYTGLDNELLWIAGWGEDHKTLAAEFARIIPGQVRKEARGDDFDLIGKIRGLKVQMIVDRAKVCERVVIGTETVTIPATEPVEAQPERVEEREVVEWRCHPILADREPEEAVA